MACSVAALLTLVMGISTAAVDVAVHVIAGVDRELGIPAIRAFFLYSPWAIGASVASTWMLAWLGGRWKAEPTWIDRLGRGLGWAWIALAVATYCLRLSL
jgi:hypothetical protein